MSPIELSRRLRRLPGFLAEDRVGLRGFIIIEPLTSGIGLLVAAGLRDTWGITPFLDLLLPSIIQVAQDNQLSALVFIGNTTWLLDELKGRGFFIREWLVGFERQGTHIPDAPAQACADLRPVHFSDLPALLELDDLAFEHIWHKSASSFNEAMARAASFTVAVAEGRIVAYQWCELYDKHAHLTRLAVHPEFQGRGIGAQLLYQAIADAINLGADLITLNTQETNQRSQLLYERYGFVNTRQRMPVLWLNLV
jgi:ribosomal-protein-alanine N-acetyltransferase